MGTKIRGLFLNVTQISPVLQCRLTTLSTRGYLNLNSGRSWIERCYCIKMMEANQNFSGLEFSWVCCNYFALKWQLIVWS
jgi:hypothetical protein